MTEKRHKKTLCTLWLKSRSLFSVLTCSFDSGFPLKDHSCFSVVKAAKGCCRIFDVALTQISTNADIPITSTYAPEKNNTNPSHEETDNQHRSTTQDASQVSSSVSFSSFLTINRRQLSSLVWSFQSKKNQAWSQKVPLLFSWLWAKWGLHMLLNCAFCLQDMLHRRQIREAKSALFNPHNIIMIEGVCHVGKCWLRGRVTALRHL